MPDPAPPPARTAVPEWERRPFSLRRFIELVPELVSWLWLMRVPILCLGFLNLLAWCSGVNLIRGAFDVNSQLTLFYVTLAVFLFVWAARMVASLVWHHGVERFGVERIKLPKFLNQVTVNGMGVALWTLLGAGPVLACWKVGDVTRPEALPGFLAWVPGGLAPAAAVLMIFLGWLAAYGLYMTLVLVQRWADPPPTDNKGLAAKVEEGPMFDLWLPGATLKKLYKAADEGLPGEVQPMPGGVKRSSWVNLARAAAQVAGRAVRGVQGAFVKLLGWLPEALGRGFLTYVDGKVVAVSPGIVAAAAASVAGFIFFWGQRDLGIGWEPQLPAIFYVVWLLTVLCWCFGVVAFFLDRWRLPSIACSLAVLCLIALGLKGDYTFRTRKTDLIPPSAGDVLAKRLTPEGTPPKRIILVAVQGGGIHSGTWATHVLGSLEARSRELGLTGAGNGFKESIVLVSGVSGGSYGLMFWVDSYSPDYPWKDAPYSPRDHAMRDSLTAAVRGLVYRDLWVNTLPSFLLGKDRGSEIEARWSVRKAGDPRGRLDEVWLSQWAADAAAGTRPAVLFNSTSQEKGLPVVFGTTSFFQDGTDDREFRNRRFVPYISMDGISRWWVDTPVPTAARMSSTFPWVLPMARPSDKDEMGRNLAVNNQHLADGGYYDNFGMGSLSRWLDAALTQHFSQTTPSPPLEILVLQVWDGTTTELRPDDTAPTDHGVAYQALSPLTLLINQRSHSHSVRNNQEYNLLCDKWRRCGLADIHTACFEFPYDDAALSWHLTSDEVRQIVHVPVWRQQMDNQGGKTLHSFTLGDLEQHPDSIQYTPAGMQQISPAQLLEQRRAKLDERLQKLFNAADLVERYLKDGQL